MPAEGPGGTDRGPTGQPTTVFRPGRRRFQSGHSDSGGVRQRAATQSQGRPPLTLPHDSCRVVRRRLPDHAGDLSLGIRPRGRRDLRAAAQIQFAGRQHRDLLHAPDRLRESRGSERRPRAGARATAPDRSRCVLNRTSASPFCRSAHRRDRDACARLRSPSLQRAREFFVRSFRAAPSRRRFSKSARAGLR